MLITIYDKQIQSNLASVKGINKISSFVPSVCLAVINGIIPIINSKIVEYEAWDFQDQLVKQQVWRMYLAKIINLMIFVVINIEMVSGETWFWSQPLMTFNQQPGPIFDCREDLFAVNFFKQVITEFVVKIVVETVQAFVKMVLARLTRKQKWKEEYNLSAEIVWILYFQSIIWISMVFFPFLAIAAPVMLYITFKYNYWSLKRLQERPERSSNSSVSS